jgi:tetratricopeptide (TPR) repeat protein
MLARLIFLTALAISFSAFADDGKDASQPAMDPMVSELDTTPDPTPAKADQDLKAATVATTAPDRKPSSNFDDEIKKLKEASSNHDESGVLQSATHILGEDPKNLAALNALAVHYYNQGKYGMSKILILRALNDHQNSATLYNNLGVIYLSENKQRQAMGYFRKALELQPKYAYASSNLGAICLEYKDYNKAASILESGYNAVKSDLRRGSYSMDVASNYAQALSGAGQSEAAQKIFKKLIDIDEQNPALLYNYAVLLVARMKNKDEGEKIIARLKFIADDPTLKKVQDLEKMMGGT